MGKSYGQLFWQRIDKYPPVLCRLLARLPKGRPLTDAEIAEKSGLSQAQVEAYSRQTDWTGIDLPNARSFMLGCGTDLSNRAHCKRIVVYLKSQPKQHRSRFTHLRRDPQWETHYVPLIKILFNHMRAKYAKDQTGH